MTTLHCFLGLDYMYSISIPFYLQVSIMAWLFLWTNLYMQLHFTFWWKRFSNKLWNGFCKHTFKLLFIIPVGTSFGFKSKALFKLTGLPVELHIGNTDNRYGPNLCKIPRSTCWLRDLGEQQDLLRHHGICLQLSYGSNTDEINEENVLLIYFHEGVWAFSSVLFKNDVTGWPTSFFCRGKQSAFFVMEKIFKNLGVFV